MVSRVILCLLLLPLVARAGSHPDADRLASECDSLIADAIRRPYGWGWTRDAAGESQQPGNKIAPRVIALDPLCTPAAGVVLLWAGRELHEPRFIEAARQAARGIEITQRSTGRVNSNVIFSRAPIVNEERSAVSDRSATRAALALLLALIDGQPAATTQATDDPSRRTAVRCTTWLMHQLTPNHFWPSAFPADASAKDAIRIVRLDDSDYRDSSIALLLSNEIVPEEMLARFADAPVEALQRVILKHDIHGPNLWSTAITIDAAGTPANFPRGPDVLASRFVMQTLLAGYLLKGDHQMGIALDAAATTLRQSKRADDHFDRFLDPTAAADVARQLGNPSTTQSTFQHPATTQSARSLPISLTFTSGDFGISSLLDGVSKLKTVGRERYIAMISTRFTLRQQLIAMLCGLDDDPLTLTLPLSADEVPAYFQAESERFKLLDQPPPADLPGRIQRIWLLLIRAKLEAMNRQAS